MYHPTTAEIHARRKELAPDVHDAFEAFSRAVFADGALPAKTKQLIAVAVAHTTQCPYCIRGHTPETCSRPAQHRAPRNPRSPRASCSRRRDAGQHVV